MGRRSRSKSPGFTRDRGRRLEHHRDKERERDKDLGQREYDRERDRHRRKRSRSRGVERRGGERRGERRYSRSRSRSRSRSIDAPRPRGKNVHDRPPITAADLEGKTPEEQEMIKIMGFANFDTTKGKRVDGNDVGEVHVILKRKYRQYMNRKGGFNRPLDFVA